MKARYEALLARLDALAPSERVLVTAAAVLVVALAWFELGIDPMIAERRALTARAATTQARIAEADALAAQIIEIAQRDPNAALRRDLDDVKARIARFEAEIRERAGELIPPRQIPGVLRGVLEQSRGLAFIGLEGLGAQPLLAPEDGEGGAANAYRHGFRITFGGSYLDTVAYLQALEALPWRFFWDAVELRVERHPTAHVSVVVYTLSLDRRWIGV